MSWLQMILKILELSIYMSNSYTLPVWLGSLGSELCPLSCLSSLALVTPITDNKLCVESCPAGELLRDVEDSLFDFVSEWGRAPHRSSAFENDLFLECCIVGDSLLPWELKYPGKASKDSPVVSLCSGLLLWDVPMWPITLFEWRLTGKILSESDGSCLTDVSHSLSKTCALPTISLFDWTLWCSGGTWRAELGLLMPWCLCRAFLLASKWPSPGNTGSDWTGGLGCFKPFSHVGSGVVPEQSTKRQCIQVR